MANTKTISAVDKMKFFISLLLSLGEALSQKFTVKMLALAPQPIPSPW